MSLPKHHLELLSPARDVSIAKEAILHGADAVYIGGPSFGARHNKLALKSMSLHPILTTTISSALSKVVCHSIPFH